MSAANSSPAFPPFEELQENGQKPKLTDEAYRLSWNLQGPLVSAISVLDISRDAKLPQEPYIKQTSAGMELHPLAHAALTEPKVSSLSVVVEELEDWADDWHAFFFCYQDRELGEFAASKPEDGARAPHMPKYDNPDMEPPPGPALEVKSSSENGYVTIHDYVSAVHPWLLSLRENILWAMNSGGSPLAAQTKLVVYFSAPDANMLWIDADEKVLILS